MITVTTTDATKTRSIQVRRGVNGYVRIRKARRTKTSQALSTTTVASVRARGVPVFRLSQWARSRSPTRAGSTLFAPTPATTRLTNVLRDARAWRRAIHRQRRPWMT